MEVQTTFTSWDEGEPTTIFWYIKHIPKKRKWGVNLKMHMGGVQAQSIQMFPGGVH